jgi:hypothetical protein
MAAERQLVEQMRGRVAEAVCGSVSVSPSETGKVFSLRDMAGAFLAGGIGRARRGLHGDPLAGGGDGLHPQGRSAAEDGAGQLFCFAMQSRDGRVFVGRRVVWIGHPGGGK